MCADTNAPKRSMTSKSALSPAAQPSANNAARAAPSNDGADADAQVLRQLAMRSSGREDDAEFDEVMLLRAELGMTLPDERVLFEDVATSAQFKSIAPTVEEIDRQVNLARGVAVDGDLNGGAALDLQQLAGLSSSTEGTRSRTRRGPLTSNDPWAYTADGEQRCFGCGETGHVRAECPGALCFRCSQPGHRSADCRSTQRSLNARSAAPPLPAARAAPKQFSFSKRAPSATTAAAAATTAAAAPSVSAATAVDSAATNGTAPTAAATTSAASTATTATPAAPPMSFSIRGVKRDAAGSTVASSAAASAATATAAPPSADTQARPTLSKSASHTAIGNGAPASDSKKRRHSEAPAADDAAANSSSSGALRYSRDELRPRAVFCFNCGEMGHRGEQCSRSTIEEMMRRDSTLLSDSSNSGGPNTRARGRRKTR